MRGGGFEKRLERHLGVFSGESRGRQSERLKVLGSGLRERMVSWGEGAQCFFVSFILRL